MANLEAMYEVKRSGNGWQVRYCGSFLGSSSTLAGANLIVGLHRSR
jgi:hypothetical protein